MKLPLVSVIMPTLNSGRFIRETIHSLIDQVYTRFEVIVIDGGSTDDTVPIVESYMGDGDLKLIQLAPGLGIAKALNVGIAASEGEFIARMDADDIAYKWRLHDQVYFFITQPEISLIGTGADTFWNHEGTCRSPRWQYDIVNEFLVNNPFFHPTIMFRRKLFDKGAFYYDESQTCDEDYELWGRLIHDTVCANLDQSSIRYRIHGASWQWDPRKYRFKRKAIMGFCERYGIADDFFVDSLTEFQCSAFIRNDNYLCLRDYAREAEAKNLPKLGWIQDAIVREKNYVDFVTWFRRTKGWAV